MISSSIDLEGLSAGDAPDLASPAPELADATGASTKPEPLLSPQPTTEVAWGADELDDLDYFESSLARRAKTLACTVPVHELEQVKGSVHNGTWRGYTMWALAFVAIDTVTVHMDFDRGASQHLVIDDMVRYAALQAPDAPPGEHREVCGWVLNRLIGTDEERRFTVSYGDYENGYVQREFPFSLITEAPDREGHIFLRATDEAINVLIGALDHDIESAQEAAEAKLDNLVRRRRLSEARAAADDALRHTIRLQEHIRTQLAATERDLRTVDWDRLSATLVDALAHVARRCTSEGTILDHLVETREKAEHADLRRKATVVIDLLRECLRRHRHLQRVLHGAREVFMAEQDRQTFSPPAAADLRSYDLHEDLLVPLLMLSLRDADLPLERFAGTASGPRDLRLGALDSVIETLLAPANERIDLGAPVVEAQMHDTTLPPRFDDASYDAVERLLAIVGDTPCRLSELLDSIEDVATAQLLALHAGFAFSAPLHGTGAGADLVAFGDGRPLPDDVLDRFDLRGDDLLLVRLDKDGS